MQQKLYQSEAYPLCFEFQEVIEVISGKLSHKPVKFAILLPFFVIGC
jgi:hypothetical protein